MMDFMKPWCELQRGTNMKTKMSTIEVTSDARPSVCSTWLATYHAEWKKDNKHCENNLCCIFQSIYPQMGKSYLCMSVCNICLCISVALTFGINYHLKLRASHFITRGGSGFYPAVKFSFLSEWKYNFVFLSEFKYNFFYYQSVHFIIWPNENDIMVVRVFCLWLLA